MPPAVAKDRLAILLACRRDRVVIDPLARDLIERRRAGGFAGFSTERNFVGQVEGLAFWIGGFDRYFQAVPIRAVAVCPNPLSASFDLAAFGFQIPANGFSAANKPTAKIHTANAVLCKY
jgi:threonine dehydrogenase-like Zn-dependent dehydrogenase